MPVQLPEPRLWTREEYDRAIEVGLFAPDERLELIEGIIYRKMPQGSMHAAGIRAAEEALRGLFGQGYDVRVQLPLALSGSSEPEPDVSVVVGSFRDYVHRHPQMPILAIEVADTSLGVDRTTKAAMYARAGIPEYWILNVADRMLEVYRDPAPLEQPPGGEYRTVHHVRPDQEVSPISLPSITVIVSTLLP